MKDWNDVHRAAAALRPMVEISEDAWNVANKVLGPAQAAASIALTLRNALWPADHLAT